MMPCSSSNYRRLLTRHLSLRCIASSGVGANVTSVSVVVQIEGLPPVTVPVTSPAVAAPSPPATSNKSSSIGPIAGGIAGGVVVIGQHSCPSDLSVLHVLVAGSA